MASAPTSLKASRARRVSLASAVGLVSDGSIPRLHEALEKSGFAAQPVGEAQFQAALDEFGEASTKLQLMTVSGAQALAGISAYGDRIDRLNAENARSLEALIDGPLP